MSNSIQVSGVFPHTAMYTSILPSHTESGIGAMIPWGGKLWVTNYVADIGANTGSALYSIDENMQMERFPGSVSGTYGCAMILEPVDCLNIGPYIIDRNNRVRVIPEIGNYRLISSMKHLTDPEHLFYVQSMEGWMFEVNMRTLASRKVCNLYRELQYPGSEDAQVDTCQSHIMGAVTAQGRIIVTSNTYTEEEFSGKRAAGRLAEYVDGKWHIVEKKPFSALRVSADGREIVYAMGWDKASAIMKVLIDGKWTTYRLPKASMNYEHHWAEEAPVISQLETGSYLLDFFGMFYELCPIPYGGVMQAVRPISTHLRKINGICSYRGMTVLSGDEVTPLFGWAPQSGDPHSNLVFCKTDDLWKYGKPQGWGGPWWDTDVQAGIPSEPYLAYGFDKKFLHVRSDKPVRLRIEADYTGDLTWNLYQEVTLEENGYAAISFPAAFEAHWLRLVPSNDAKMSASFFYT